MMDNAIAKRYAQALFALAQERQEIKKIEEELLAIKEALESNDDLRSIIYHQLIAAGEKKQLVEQLFKNVSEITLNFIKLLIDKGREKFLETIIVLYHEMCLELDKVVTAEVKTAVPLSDENREALIAKLSQITGKKVVIQEEIDEKLLGGIVVTIGDKILDGSVKARLNALRSTLNKVQI